MLAKRYCGLLVLGTVIGVSSASAQSDSAKEEPRAGIVEHLFDCRAIEDSSERLACFDREVDRVYQARESKELVITDREEIKQTRKGLFGFTLPKIGIFKGEDNGVEEISQVTATIASARQNRNGRYILTLESGAQWVQVDKVPVFGNPSAGDEVVIEKGILGSYKAKIGKRRAFKVKRVE